MSVHCQMILVNNCSALVLVPEIACVLVSYFSWVIACDENSVSELPVCHGETPPLYLCANQDGTQAAFCAFSFLGSTFSFRPKISQEESPEAPGQVLLFWLWRVVHIYMCKRISILTFSHNENLLFDNHCASAMHFLLRNFNVNQTSQKLLCHSFLSHSIFLMDIL